MELSGYFDPVNRKKPGFLSDYEQHQLGQRIKHPDFEKGVTNIQKAKIAIIGVPEDRDSGNAGSRMAPDEIRKKLYELYFPYPINIVDLGNLKTGKTTTDTQYGLAEAIKYLRSKKIIILILGGSSNLTYGNYLGYEEFNKSVNIVSADSTFRLKHKGVDPSDLHFIPRIILKNDNLLFNYSIIGYQTYLVSPSDLDLASKLYFDAYRLGHVQANIAELEPVLRDADIFSFTLSSVQSSQSPAHKKASPNGFTAKEACQLARYGGLGDRLSSFALYDVNPSLDSNGQSAALAAQVAWHFMEGVAQRKKEYPAGSLSSCTKFHVDVGKGNFITFYKSQKTDRWWMEIPNGTGKNAKNLVISCSHEDYTLACGGQIPDRWWKFFRKIS